MRLVTRAILLTTAALLAQAASPKRPAALTIVLEFQGTHSDRSIAEMKRELATVMKDSGLIFDWRTKEEAKGESFDNLVVVRLKGKCILEPVPYLYDERGPLAFTYASGDDVLPFSEVACDRVVEAARSAMSGSDFAHADLLLGRALGRVVAHELVHMLSKSGEHGREGVTQPALSGLKLIAPEMHLSASDLERIYTQP
ncbi:MAG TPA: hypothetical protein VKU19_42030 [Bryobacteraceae bacterium]|nr:hypothetical protein [Bryobacteraceae bacterium]